MGTIVQKLQGLFRVDAAATHRELGKTTGRETLQAVLVYTVMAFVATWPLVLHLGDHVPGTDTWNGRGIGSESPVNLWNLWWFRHSVLELRQSPFHCALIFYPVGASLWSHTLSPLLGAVGLLLQAIFQLVVTQNIIILGCFSASGVCTFRLARALGFQSSSSLVAGAVFAFCPVVFSHLYAGHVELLTTFWFPAMLLCFLRIIEAQNPLWRHGIALGLLFVAAAYSCQYYCVFGAELLAVAAVVRWRRLLRTRVVGILAAGVIVAILGVLPILRQFVGDTLGQPRARDLILLSGDFLGAIVPSFMNPLAKHWLAPVHARLLSSLPQEVTVFLGFSVLGLAIYAVLKHIAAILKHESRHAWLTLLMSIAVTFWVLSLGSRLKVYGHLSHIPLPSAAFVNVPVLSHIRAPGRYFIPAMLGFSLWAGAGFDWITSSRRRLAIIALIALEYAAVPVPLWSTKVTDAYYRLAELPPGSAVLELPLGIRDGRRSLGRPDPTQIYAQTIHGRPIVTGMVSRLPDATFRAFDRMPVIGTLLRREYTTESLLRDAKEGPGFLARWNFNAILVHPAARNSAALRYIERVLPIENRETFPDGSQLLGLAKR